MIGLADIRRARERTADALLVTPCLKAHNLSQQLGAEVLLKCETLQRTGSFKPRGALNKVLTLAEEQRGRGVIAASAGNHAQGVAFAAHRVGCPALIVMPETTPLVKISQTRRWGAEVVLAGTSFQEASERARQIQQERGLTYVHAFDDEEIVAGQGTIALEIAEQVPAVDVVVAPIGGGGLISGIAAGLAELRPGIRVFGVQSDASPSMKASFDSGVLTDAPTRPSIAEGISIKYPGAVTFEYVRRLVDDVVLVSEEEIADAVFRLLESDKLVTEGAGAASFAALLQRRVPGLGGRTVVVVLSGANIDLNTMSRLIERSLVRQRRLTRLRLTIQDRPGALAAALAIVAQHGGNVLDIHHERFFGESAFWETEVELTLETRDREQVDALLAALRAAGHSRIEEPAVPLPPPSLTPARG